MSCTPLLRCLGDSLGSEGQTKGATCLIASTTGLSILPDSHVEHVFKGALVPLRHFANDFKHGEDVPNERLVLRRTQHNGAFVEILLNGFELDKLLDVFGLSQVLDA